MATFLMCGKYSPQALGQMSAQRTGQAVELIGKFGGEVQSMFATLGERDLLLVVSLPSTEDAIKASVALARLTGIAFSTTPAVRVEEFDQLMEQI